VVGHRSSLFERAAVLEIGNPGRSKRVAADLVPMSARRHAGGLGGAAPGGRRGSHATNWRPAGHSPISGDRYLRISVEDRSRREGSSRIVPVNVAGGEAIKRPVKTAA
jgi:hypothetical protein